MKLIWFFLHITVLSTIAVNPAEAFSDSKISISPHQVCCKSHKRVQMIHSHEAIKPREQPSQPPVTQSEVAKPEVLHKTTYFQRARSYGTHPESDPPRYVRNLAKTEINAFKDLDWLDVGLDYRVRYELRDNDIRRNSLLTDHPVLLRTRALCGHPEYC